MRSYSFVLADGTAPFQILGRVRLSILFANVETFIDAYVARKLCTNIILGMDYINKYCLSFDVKRQAISIEYHNHFFIMDIDPHNRIPNIPVTSSRTILIPPYSTRTVPVTVPISFIASSLIPNRNLSNSSSLIVRRKFVTFHNYYSVLSFCNTSSVPRFISKGYCVGFLSSRTERYSLIGTSASHSLYGTTGSTGEFTASDNLDSTPCSSTISLCYSSNVEKSNPTHPIVSKPTFYCNSIQRCPPTLNRHLTELVKSIGNEFHRKDLYNLLIRFAKIFDSSKHSIANTSIHHVINTVRHSPPACKPYPQPDKEQAMYQLIQEFLQAGLISESYSPYAAPAILVKKKDGSYRFVVDYKKLNLITIKDSSPLPNMEDALRKLGEGYCYFSKLDLKSGFYQIPIKAVDKEKTAFVTPFGLYQFNVLPMGLKNSPPTFQKVMTDTLKPCRNFSLVYLDDIIVFSKSFNEHLYHLESVLAALYAKNLILNPPKCVLAAHEIDYLGHTITQTKITPMREKIEAILQLKEPSSLSQANKFLGALSWYRKFIPHFATAAAPLNAVTNLTKDQRHKFKWTSAQSKAFHDLKSMLVSQPLFLHYPVDNVPLMLATDASGIGVGGVLQQIVNGEVRNLYYHSQLITPCERKYSAIEKEALAIYKCFARMRTFLLGRSIIIRTDHCPLCHIMEKTVHNARVDRITHLIQEYNIEKVIHINGRENCLPDFLSRYSNETDDLFEIDYGLESKSNTKIIQAPSPQTIFNTSLNRNTENQKLLASMVLRSHTNPSKLTNIDDASSKDLLSDQQSDIHSDIDQSSTRINQNKFSCNQFDLTKLEAEQKKDPDIQNIVERTQSGTHTLPFVLKNNLVYRLITPRRYSKRNIEVIYVPSSMTLSLLKACHDDPMTGAHFSFDRTYHKIKSHFWWPNMKLSIRNYIRSCILCKQYNIRRHKRHGHLRPITPPEGPFLLVGIDYCGPLKRTPRENQYVLIITDYFTRHITAIALPNCTAETTAQTLFNEYFCKYGVPAVILSDQGSHFRNQLMENITRLIGYNHIYSTPYHPQTNGVVERFNATFVPQISKLQDTQNNNWDEYLQAVVFAYNTGIHKTTRYSPYELLYGRPARLPIHKRPDCFSFNRPNDYFEQLRKTLRIYHQAAKHQVVSQQQNAKISYDYNRSNPQYKIGDKVLSRIQGSRGKLEPKFSPIPKIIVRVNHPIYEVQDEQTNVMSQVHVSDLCPVLIH
jgi:hypothetical protein